jgi:inner membrane protein involved in colicin E2 resistance
VARRAFPFTGKNTFLFPNNEMPLRTRQFLNHAGKTNKQKHIQYALSKLSYPLFFLNLLIVAMNAYTRSSTSAYIYIYMYVCAILMQCIEHSPFTY